MNKNLLYLLLWMYDAMEFSPESVRYFAEESVKEAGEGYGIFRDCLSIILNGDLENSLDSVKEVAKADLEWEAKLSFESRLEKEE
jgi:hypothetical protein